jgi:regulator of sirC expression with transglutaminase-like and TPR domain
VCLSTESKAKRKTPTRFHFSAATINHMDLDAELALLSREPGRACDLAELALLLARDEYPAVDVEAYLGELDGMAHEAARLVRGSLRQRVEGLCRYLFHDMGFHGNCHDYYDPRNSYLNDVLDRRTGLPLTLSLVAIAVGTRVGLDVRGVGLPGHFVAHAFDGDQAVLFDPFHGGRLLEPDECASLVLRVTGVPFQPTPDRLAASSARAIAVRMLTNLKSVYLQERDFPRAARVIIRLLQLRPSDVHERRDLGVALLHAGRPGKAIDHLTAYLEAAPASVDGTIVRTMLAQARAQVARWN